MANMEEKETAREANTKLKNDLAQIRASLRTINSSVIALPKTLLQGFVDFSSTFAGTELDIIGKQLASNLKEFRSLLESFRKAYSSRPSGTRRITKKEESFLDDCHKQLEILINFFDLLNSLRAMGLNRGKCFSHKLTRSLVKAFSSKTNLRLLECKHERIGHGYICQTCGSTVCPRCGSIDEFKKHDTRYVKCQRCEFFYHI